MTTERQEAQVLADLGIRQGFLPGLGFFPNYRERIRGEHVYERLIHP